MSFLAKAEIGGKEYNVFKCSYSLHQEVDHHGRPSGTVRGGTINLVVESSDDNSLYGWMVDPYKTLDGKITFNKKDDKAKLKELEFKTAYVIKFEEAFDAFGEDPMRMIFTLSAKDLSMEGVPHVNAWPI